MNLSPAFATEVAELGLAHATFHVRTSGHALDVDLHTVEPANMQPLGKCRLKMTKNMKHER